MPTEPGGKGLALLALLLSLIALGISVLAYQQAGGARQLNEQVRTLQQAVDIARNETADALSRIERVVRPAESAKEAARGAGR